METSIAYQPARLSRYIATPLGGANRSDNDDKSLSNDETPPPTFPRQPPDGVETPSDSIEKAPESSTPPLPASLPSTLRLPPRLPPTVWPISRGRGRTSYSRSQDARSECSVKDKIAMFSVDRSASVERVDRCDLPFAVKAVPSISRNSSSVRKNNFPDVQALDRRLTKSQDNLDEVLSDRSYRPADKRPEVLGANHTPRKCMDRTENKTKYSDFGTTTMHFGSTTNLAASKMVQHSESVYHTRSVSDDGFGAAHKSTLEYLIEQRKKSMSKLRGLMIPDIQAPIVDLPEIKVQECNAAKNLVVNSRQNDYIIKESIKNKSYKKTPINLADSWKNTLLPNNIPKYSPAFKRKSLQVYSTSSSLSKESNLERRQESPLDTRPSYGVDSVTAKHIPIKPPRTSIDLKKSYNDRSNLNLPSRISLSSAMKLAGKVDKGVYEKYREYGNVDVKVCTVTEIVDSDNDSAVSSTQSSYRSSASSPLHNIDSVESDSSHLSPRSSHYISYSLVKAGQPKVKEASKTNAKYVKRNVYRSVSSDTNASVSSSVGSAATSGSQASCSSLESSVTDSGKKKVTRTHSVDTINRRNILASAKCRSGRDLNVSSPVVETKFNHESPDRSPSPQKKSSDRLTTLTSSVSGLSNKGEVRRVRSKVIADTDSDSESELNIRQRKSDFKNSRLKKNVISQVVKVESPRKQMECSVSDNIIAADPQIISQRIIKEIKKAGLRDLLPERNVILEKNNNNKHISKEDISPKKTENGLMNSVANGDRVSRPAYKTESEVFEKIDTIHTVVNKVSKETIEDVTDGKPSTSYKVCLKKGVGAGVGLILAGGIDCEAKAVTVHKVLAGSVAEREGLLRGARVLSINGRTMDGLTHAETVAVLKESRAEVIIEIENENRESSSSGEYAEPRLRDDSGTAREECSGAGSQVSVTLEKSGAGAGLGFGLDGGKDSPSGDLPLTIKKLFAGGAAARCGRVAVGAELMSAGGRDMRGLTRTQAWTALKELPAGPVVLLLRNPR